MVKAVAGINFHLYEAADETFPAASTVRTANWCCPLFDVSTMTVKVNGLVHVPKGPFSTLHWNVTGDSGSVNSKVEMAVGAGSVGFAVIIGAGGGVVSTVHGQLVEGLSFPAASRAFTWNV